MPAKCGSSPREKVGIDLSVRLSAPGSPMSSAHCCSLRQPASDSLPSASSAFQPCVAMLVEIGMMAVHAFARGKQPGLARHAREWISHQDLLFVVARR